MTMRSMAALLAAGAIAMGAAGCGSGKSGTPNAQASVSGSATPTGSPATGTTSATGLGGTPASGSATSTGAAPSHSTHSSGNPTATTSRGSSADGADPWQACVAARPDPAPVPGSTLPRAATTDVQCLPDPLWTNVLDGTYTGLSRMADPSTASRGLRSWILSPYSPDLATFDQAAYGVHGDRGPSMLVAIATPKPLDGTSAHYPDFVGGILRSAGATGLYTPPNTGHRAQLYSLVITCGHEPLHGRTLCVWTGTRINPDNSRTPFVGTLVWLANVSTTELESVSENALYSIIAG